MANMRFRKLRIASICWGLACLLLIVLWVRSYLWDESLYWNIVGDRSVIFASARGRLAAFVGLFELSPGPRLRLVEGDVSFVHTDVYPLVNTYRAFDILGPDALGCIGRALVVPHWITVLITAGLAILGVKGPYQLRYNIRTLLIATTLIAVVLGFAVYAARK